jgi:hypothetical protein
MSHDVAQSTDACLTAVAAVDPYVPESRSRLRDFRRTVFTNVNHNTMRGSTRLAIEDFERQNSRRRIEARRIVSGAEWRFLRAIMAGHDVAIVPAWVAMDGLLATVEHEIASVLARKTRVPVLRVASTPLHAKSVLFVMDNTSLNGQVRRYVRLGLWPDARVVILPVGGSSVGDSIDEQRDFLRAHGRNAAVLPPLDLDFEMPDLEDLARQFHVAVIVSRSSRRLFGPAWNKAVRTVAKRVPVILMI